MNRKIYPYDMDDVVVTAEEVRNLLTVVQWWLEDYERRRLKRDKDAAAVFANGASTYTSVLSAAMVSLRDLQDGATAALEAEVQA